MPQDRGVRRYPENLDGQNPEIRAAREGEGSSVRTAGLTAAPSPVRQLLFETGDFLFQLELLALELGQANRVGHGAVDLVIDGLLQAVMFFDERFEMRRCIHRDLQIGRASGRERVCKYV